LLRLSDGFYEAGTAKNYHRRFAQELFLKGFFFEFETKMTPELD